MCDCYVYGPYGPLPRSIMNVVSRWLLHCIEHGHFAMLQVGDRHGAMELQAADDFHWVTVTLVKFEIWSNFEGLELDELDWMLQIASVFHRERPHVFRWLVPCRELRLQDLIRGQQRSLAEHQIIGLPRWYVMTASDSGRIQSSQSFFSLWWPIWLAKVQAKRGKCLKTDEASVVV